jgi:hypothetical protein
MMADIQEGHTRAKCSEKKTQNMKFGTDKQSQNTGKDLPMNAV